jgi:RNA polymerase sigma factor (sigma-70 family)
LEASALTHASRRGLLARRSPLLRLQVDERLVALVRDGNPRAFDAIVDRYRSRLLGFCRQMLVSNEDAEDVLQEVFVNAYRAMLADSREINLRPWLYRIARNRCLNHLRKPAADAQETMDGVAVVDAASTHERAQNREEFRQLLCDVGKLPETQRSALMLREMDALSYEDIAQAMDTTVPSVKSLLVRARISLAEASQARQLTCGEVRLELAEAVEGLCKVSGPVRRHVRECDECGEFRSQVRSDAKALAALSPIGPLLALKAFLSSKLGGGAAGTGAASSGAAGAGGVSGAGATGAGALGSGAGLAAGGAGAIGGTVGVKAVAGVVSAAVLTAGAVQVEKRVLERPAGGEPAVSAANTVRQPSNASVGPSAAAPAASQSADAPETSPPSPPLAPPAHQETDPAAPPPATEPGATSADGSSGSAADPPGLTVNAGVAGSSTTVAPNSISTSQAPEPSGPSATTTVGDPGSGASWPTSTGGAEGEKSSTAADTSDESASSPTSGQGSDGTGPAEPGTAISTG